MGGTDERVETWKKLRRDGLSASQIAKQLGGVTRNAVIGKVHRLGLSGRAEPSQPTRPGVQGPRAPRAAAAPRRGRPGRAEPSQPTRPVFKAPRAPRPAPAPRRIETHAPVAAAPPVFY